MIKENFSDMPKNLAKTYNPKEFETRIYEEWESNKAFAPGEDHTKNRLPS